MWRKWNSVVLLVKMLNRIADTENSGISSKLNIKLPCDPEIHFEIYMSKTVESWNLNGSFYVSVHHSVIHRPSVHQQMNKQNVVYMYSGILLNCK